MFKSHDGAMRFLRSTLCIGSVAVAGVLVASPGTAGTVDDSPTFALHVQAHTQKSCSATVDPVTTDCTAYEVTGDLQTYYDIYLVVAEVDTALSDGLKGASCGIEYNGTEHEGVDVLQWTPCCDLDFPNGPVGGTEWPASGGGNRMTWVLCQDTETASGIQSTFGSFYVLAYSDDSFQITPNLNVAFPELAWNDCNGADHYAEFSHMARVDFGAGAPGVSPNPGDGYNPCLGAVEVRPTTWGKLKIMYGTHPGTAAGTGTASSFPRTHP